MQLCIKCNQNEVVAKSDGTPGKLCAMCVIQAIVSLCDESDDEEMARIDAMTTEEVEAELKAQGISVEPSPEVKARFEAARESLRQRIEAEQARTSDATPNARSVRA